MRGIRSTTNRRSGKSPNCVCASDWANYIRDSKCGRRRITAHVTSNVSFTGGRTDTRFQSPLLLRRINLAKVVNTGIGLGRLTSANEVRNRDRSEEADDGDHDHDFDEGETSFAGCIDLHITCLFCCAV